MIIEALRVALELGIVLAGALVIIVGVFSILCVIVGFAGTMIDRVQIWWHVFQEDRRCKEFNYVWKDEYDVNGAIRSLGCDADKFSEAGNAEKQD